MSDIKAEIKRYSSQAAELSKQAHQASKERDFANGKALMRKAYQASQNCQNLIQQYQRSLFSHRVKTERGESFTRD